MLALIRLTRQESLLRTLRFVTTSDATFDKTDAMTALQLATKWCVLLRATVFALLCAVSISHAANFPDILSTEEARRENAELCSSDMGAGQHKITFAATVAGDNTAFIDNVALSRIGGQQSANPGNVVYFHNDPAGTPLIATDVNGAALWKENYRPYGERINQAAPTTPNRNTAGTTLGYTGKPFDADTGLSYLGARYYDPVIGRLTGIDPAPVDETNPHSFNRYAYANNNPYRFVDPDGRVAFLVALVPFIPEITAGAGAMLVAARAAPFVQRILPAAMNTVTTLTNSSAMVNSVEVASGFVPGAAPGSLAPAGVGVKTASGRRLGDFTKADKAAAKAENAVQHGGQMQCADCGRALENVASRKGVATPKNQAQVHHDPPIKDGGGRHSEAVVLCPTCHIERHIQESR